MIDGISFWTMQAGLDKILLSISYLVFVKRYPVNEPNNASYHADYYGLKIHIYHSGLVIIRGSLHMFFNMNVHNSDDYTYGKVGATLQHLRDEFCINLDEAKIHFLEFGYNLNLPYSVNHVLSSLVCFKNKPFNPEGFEFKRCKGSAYDLKIYGKLFNLLRFELKIKKMKACKAAPLCLADLFKLSVWDKLESQLLEAIYNIIFDEGVDIDQLSPTHKKICQWSINPRNWSSKNVSRAERCRRKAELDIINQNYGRYDFKTKIVEAITSKHLYLSSTPL